MLCGHLDAPGNTTSQILRCTPPCLFQRTGPYIVANELADTPHLVDPAVTAFRDLAASTQWQNIARAGAVETALAVRATLPPPPVEIDGQDAASYLEKVIPLVEKDITDRHGSYGAVRWLWYLRRTPDLLFEGDYRTTLGYDRVLAEVVSSRCCASDVSEAPDRVAFRVNDSVFRHVARFVGRVKFLSQLHMLYRRVGKGATLVTDSPLFGSRTTDLIERAIQTYDTRHDHSQDMYSAGLGLVVLAAGSNEVAKAVESGEPVALLAFRCLPFRAPLKHSVSPGAPQLLLLDMRYAIEMLQVTRVLAPMGTSGGVASYLPEIAPLVQLLMLLPTIISMSPWALGSIAQYGYVFVTKERLRHVADRRLTHVVGQVSGVTPGFSWPADFTAWMAALQAVRSSSWPLTAGRVCHYFNNNVLIDVGAASNALIHRLELDRSPLWGALRGESFELQCQEVIGKTPWAPPPAVKAYRGRTLRRGGKALTDIDAIGVRGNTLLLVSCKSIIYDRAYDQGVFNVIRNTQATIDAAVTRWQSIINDLRLQQRGDNFDLSSYDQIVGVVCTPFVAYSSADLSLAFVVPRLRAVCSILELRDWLEGGPEVS